MFSSPLALSHRAVKIVRMSKYGGRKPRSEKGETQDYPQITVRPFQVEPQRKP